MATKPTIALARWADLITSFVTAPMSGSRDTGFQDATPADADIVNELFKQLYLWALYLNDGALTGNHTIAGTLDVTSDVSIAGTITGGASGGVDVLGDSTINGDLHVTEDLVSDALGVFATGIETGGDAAITGALAVTGETTLSGALFVAGEISPTTITSTTAINDYNPTGLSTASVIRQVVTNSGGANVNITGIVAPAFFGKILVLHALGTLAGDTVTLQHENAGSAANNRFSLASGSNLVIPQQGTVMLRYDFTSSRWRSVSKNF